MNLRQRIAKYFSIGGYDGADTSGNHRRPGPTQNASEDFHLDARKREILSANTRDILRQYSLLGWTLRRHLDFVVDFSFKAQTSDAGFNRDLESWFAEISRPLNFDVGGRHSFSRALRIAEACRTLDGDCFMLKVGGGPNRGKVQFIEADRIWLPPSDVPRGEENVWINGVKVDPRTGKAMAYAISNRVGKSRKELERIVSARNILPLGYYNYRFDQVRGISPLACAVNQLRDLYEVQNYEVVKAKLGALLGVAIMRETGAYDTATLGEATDDGDGPPVIDFAHMGPFQLELEPGEKAEILESKTPSAQTLAFIQHLIDATLLALDIPASFFDVARTNYFGSRAALLIYLLSCDDKIRDLKEFQSAYLNWRLGIALEDGEISLPSGREFDFVKFEFIEGGVPYWKPIDEARGSAMQIAMGLQSPRRAARELGRDFETIIRETAEDVAFAEAAGVALKFADSTAFNPEITVGAVND